MPSKKTSKKPTTKKTASKKSPAKSASSKSSKKFSWKKHLQETVKENNGFFMTLIVLLTLGLVTGVLMTLFVRGQCAPATKQKVTNAIQNHLAMADINCKYK